MQNFSSEEYWKAIILYGLNASTYKIAFGKTLLSLCEQGETKVPWENLSLEFLKKYQERLSVSEPMPQLDNPSRKTVMERVVQAMKYNMSLDQAITEVGNNAFGDVVNRFHNLGGIEEVRGMFYRFREGRHIELTDQMYLVYEKKLSEVTSELDARWSLLEGAFSLGGHDFVLSNDIRSIYLENATKRKSLTDQIPFLQGYQGNICFYCGEEIHQKNCHVDHVLPRQVMNHDEVWNLVLSHDHCNNTKLDRIVGMHYIEKLYKRNENIMRSNHPWKKKIEIALGSSPNSRRANLLSHYENIKSVLGPNRYWGGIEKYNPESDPFYRKLITKITLEKKSSNFHAYTNSKGQFNLDF